MVVSNGQGVMPMAILSILLIPTTVQR